MQRLPKQCTCTECGSENQFLKFVDLEGNGIKCGDCLHKKYIFKPKKGERMVDKRLRMATNWKKALKIRKF